MAAINIIITFTEAIDTDFLLRQVLCGIEFLLVHDFAFRENKLLANTEVPWELKAFHARFWSSLKK